MKLSAKSRYAIVAMMDLALNEHTHPLTLTDISKNQGISLSYLEQIFSRLRQHRLVEGVRGPGGGYRLGRPANNIRITDIIDVVDGDEEYATNLSGRKVYEPNNMWSKLSNQLHDFLEGISLGDFVDSSLVPQQFDAIKVTPAYQISHMFRPTKALMNSRFN